MTTEPSPADNDGVHPPPQRATPSGLRASDAEREQVVEALSEHATTGRLTLAELEERITLAYRATTRDEIDQLVTDLPASDRSAPAPEPSRRKLTRWILAVMGGSDKRGRWGVGRRVTAVAVMGGHTIDLRNAELSADDTTIVAVNWMGGTDIYVPDTIDLHVGGFSVMGGTGEHGSTRAPRRGAPRIRVLAYNLMGGTDVWRMPEEANDVPLKQARKIAKKSA
ncbi:DUF1707 SHOCT-like domain-containing protein [Haloactinopolyspora alba]|nr:DUF1707 domain-containing protein [Haloactinopolyspora alba]